jgi:putative membrane protein
MQRFLIRWAILAVAIALTAKIVGGLKVTGGFWAYVWVAAIFGLVNAFLGPVLHLLALPLTILTLGLFALIVNAVLLSIAAAISSHLSIDGFATAVWAALLIAIFSTLMNRFLLDRQGWAHRR